MCNSRGAGRSFARYQPYVRAFELKAIDDLLLAPEVAVPPQITRGRVLDEFADPDLERRSAGQKMLMRMGADNARRVKATLWDIRRELLAASAPR